MTISYFNFKESQTSKKYLKMKLEAKINIERLAKQQSRSHLDMEDETNVSSNGGGKEEVMKAEGLLQSNSSFVDMYEGGKLTKRMKDEGLDHSKVLSESKYPITRICLTGGPCAGKTTALSTLS